MSGRLVISRHKSWHVWNQDNQEKVLRDERLAREAEEERKSNEKKRLQEKNLELLGGESIEVNVESNGSEKISRSNKQADIQSNKKIEPPPEVLGDLALSKPWYMKDPDSETNRDIKQSKTDEEDPMKKFLEAPVISEAVLLSDKGDSSRRFSSALPSYSSLNIDELRAKRLKREKIERKRAILLLANRDIYGDNVKRKKYDH